MNVQGINRCPKPCFQAQLKDTENLTELTKIEVAEGRYSAYKNALKNLQEVHQGEVIDICQMPDGKSYKITNKTKGYMDVNDYSANLTDVVNELARPTSRIHKEVFDCDASNETNEIRYDFYA